MASGEVRRPRPGGLTPKQQCASDWAFWAECASDFLKTAESRAAADMQGKDFHDVAHTLKTSAEGLGMMGIALAAFDLEVAARTGAGEVTLLHLQAALMAAISDMCNALERPSFKADPVAALEAVEGYWDKLLLPAPAPTPSPPQAAPAPAPPQQRAPSGQFAQPAPALTPHAVAKALAFGSQPDAPLPSRLAVVASDPELRTSVCVAIIAATSQGVQITTVPFASVDEAVDDEAPVMVLCTDGSDVPTNLPPCAGNGAPRGYVVYGEVDAPFREGIFSSMHRWCDLVRPPLVVPELVCRIRRVYASVQLMAPLAGIQARFVQ